jgi:Cu/Ag efflux pump CusA
VQPRLGPDATGVGWVYSYAWSIAPVSMIWPS